MARLKYLNLDYHWEELWRSLILVLDFAANQIGTLKSVAKVDELIQEVSWTRLVRLQSNPQQP